MSLPEMHENENIPLLDEGDLAAEPIEQFDKWFTAVLQANLPHPNAVTLATVSRDGQPSARIVLLKEYDAEGFIFYTNYESQKGKHLAMNPKACLVFHWPLFDRQVRIMGTVKKIPWVESDHYFQTRTRGSQLGTLASNQSKFVDSRQELERRYEELKAQYDGEQIPCPKHWGGYRLSHKSVEFWQAGPNRLHDRFLYTPQKDGTWRMRRVAP